MELQIVSKKSYAVVDGSVLRGAATHIAALMSTAVRHGKQSISLPPGVSALGQYLPPRDSNQRGLFGQAAAIIVASDSGNYDLRDELIAYLPRRRLVEESLPSTDADLAINLGKLEREGYDTFKCSEVVRSLARAGGLLEDRETTLRVWLDRLVKGRGSRGWGSSLSAPEELDLYATAMATRACGAAGVAVPDSILTSLKVACGGDNALALRALALLALAELHREDLVISEWAGFRTSLLPTLEKAHETTHRYLHGDRHYPIHVPFQIYGLQAATYYDAPSFWLRPRVQDHLRMIVSETLSDGGFSYEGLGGPLSTRTYSCLYEMFTQVATSVRGSFFAETSLRCANTLHRARTNRATKLTIIVICVAILLWSLIDWVRLPTWSVSAIAPNLVWAIIAGLIMWAATGGRRG